MSFLFVLAVLSIFLITTNSPSLNSVAGQWCLACCFSLVYCDFKMLDEASARIVSRSGKVLFLSSKYSVKPSTVGPRWLTPNNNIEGEKRVDEWIVLLSAYFQQPTAYAHEIITSNIAYTFSNNKYSEGSISAKMSRKISFDTRIFFLKSEINNHEMKHV